MAKEHTPNRALVLAMSGFFAVLSLAALLFWLAALVMPGGINGVIALVGPASVAIFSTLHIPAAIVGILLWQWYRADLAPIHRVALEAATLYFGLAVLISIFFNYLAVTLLDAVS